MKNLIILCLVTLVLLIAGCTYSSNSQQTVTIVATYHNDTKDTLKIVTAYPFDFALYESSIYASYDLWNNDNRIAAKVKSFSVINITPVIKNNEK